MSSLSHRLVEVLVAGRMKAIFGVPGGQTLPLYGAAHGAGLLHVLMRDERGAACAADAYARASGHVGFCDATVGPGATNLVSGLAEAMSSSIPIVAIVADIRTTRSHLRRRAVVSQAVDQAAMLAPLVKWVGRVERGEALDAVLDQALRIATTGRPGPVVLEIPEDVFHEEPDPSQFRNFSEREFVYPRFRSAPTAGGLAAAVDLLSGAKRPLIMAGGGVTFSGAANAVSALAQEHQIPIVTSISGKGTINERSPLAAGVTGRFGTARANAAAMAADVVLVIGCKLGQLSTHGWQLPGPGQTIIHIDVDGEEIGRTGPVALGIVADAREAASMLTTALRDTIAGRNWLGDVQPSPNDPRAASDGAVAPTRIAEVISAALREDDLLLCDASLASGWGAANTLVKKAGPNFIAPRGLAGIGWAGGAVIGARIATPPHRRVVALAGDGGWAYSLSEMETAVRLELDITYVILNNQALGWIKHIEDRLGITPPSTFTAVDFGGVARSMGAEGAHVTNLEDFEAHFQRGAGTPRTLPCRCRVLHGRLAHHRLRRRTEGRVQLTAPIERRQQPRLALDERRLHHQRGQPGPGQTGHRRG